MEDTTIAEELDDEDDAPVELTEEDRINDMYLELDGSDSGGDDNDGV